MQYTSRFVYWAAIDFETANSARSSACSVGVALVDNGEIVDKRDWLIRPEPLWFQPGNIAVHGINEADVEDAPIFAEIWPDFSAMLEGRMVLAHNAGFDISVLRACLDEAGIDHPDLEYACTLSLARKAYPGLDSYRLPIVADRCGFDLEAHHDALSDAVACAAIARYTLDHHGMETFAYAVDTWGIKVRNVNASASTPING